MWNALKLIVTSRVYSSEKAGERLREKEPSTSSVVTFHRLYIGCTWDPRVNVCRETYLSVEDLLNPTLVFILYIFLLNNMSRAVCSSLTAVPSRTKCSHLQLIVWTCQHIYAPGSGSILFSAGFNSISNGNVVCATIDCSIFQGWIC